MAMEMVLFFVPSLGMWVVFFWLFVQERNEKARIQELRLQDQERHSRMMAEVLAQQSVVDIRNALLDQTQTRRDNEGKPPKD